MASLMAGQINIHLPCSRHRKCGFNSWDRKTPWRRAWQSTPVFLPGESHGQRGLAGYSPWGRVSQIQMSTQITEKKAVLTSREWGGPGNAGQVDLV